MEYLNKLYSGRLNRRTYLVGSIILAIIYWLIGLIVGSLGYGSGVFSLVYWILLILMIVFGLSLSVRRFHDLGQTGWLCILLAIPLVDIGVWFYLLLAPGKMGSNVYGAQPADALELQKVYQYK